ncbi:Sel1 repeat-containing protein [Pseudoduganella lurida]|uniref:Sel1 repeat-containing protein n=1 Tax=Pseudoduganella lurida TaxID=1036180 RepID=A0A562RL74_9BURK|nr:tetratricopeptide repeat protein [Pseudoduganella lurida]TWI69795.1 Sel1 repeat-containing protein [Pseudoduganella lurida]
MSHLTRFWRAAGFALALCCASAGAADFATELADAQKGDTEAMHNVGALYAMGRGVPQDYTAAMDWFGRAARRGNYGSMYSLGIMYRFGQGVPIDMVQASAWYTIAAETIPKNADEWFIPRAKVAMYLRTADEVRKGLGDSERAAAAARAAELRREIGPVAAPAT